MGKKSVYFKDMRFFDFASLRMTKLIRENMYTLNECFFYAEKR